MSTLVNTINPGAASKNYIINGGFDIWQRGTSFAPTSTRLVGPDRYILFDLNTQSTVSQVAAVNPGSTFGMKFQRNAGQTGTGGKSFAQTIEIKNGKLLAGKTVTLSFKVKAGANFSGTTFSSRVSYGTGASDVDLLFVGFTGEVDSTQVNTPTTSFQTFTQTVAIPLTATQIGIVFTWNPTGTAGADDSLTFEQIMLNEGQKASSFNLAGNTIGGEGELCQRYYETGTIFAVGDGTNGNLIFGICTFLTQKRVVPSTTNTQFASINGGVGVGTANAGLSPTTNQMLATYNTGGSSIGVHYASTWKADAEI